MSESAEKRKVLRWVGFFLFGAGAFLGGPVMVLLMVEYKIRFLGPISTLSLIVLPMVLSVWFTAYSFPPEKRRLGLMGAGVVTLCSLAGLILASVFRG